MLALTMNCEVTAERTVTLHLPETITPGPYEIAVIFDNAIVNDSVHDDYEKIRIQRMQALERLRHPISGALSSSEAFAAAKQEEIDLEERHFVR